MLGKSTSASGSSSIGLIRLHGSKAWISAPTMGPRRVWSSSGLVPGGAFLPDHAVRGVTQPQPMIALDVIAERGAHRVAYARVQRYATFRRRSLPIGSGAVESAVRRVVNLRLKGASITWTEEHAEGIIHLRAHAKSGRWRELERVVLANTGWRPTSRLPKAAA